MAYLLGSFAAGVADLLAIMIGIAMIFIAKTRVFLFVTYGLLALFTLIVAFLSKGEIELANIMQTLGAAVPLVIGYLIGQKIRENRRAKTK